MALDVCVNSPRRTPGLDEAVLPDQPLGCALAARARRSDDTLLFAIVQGGLDERGTSAQRGRSRCPRPAGIRHRRTFGRRVRAKIFERTVRFTAALLPAERPRYLMGVGTVRDVITAIDPPSILFDCVYRRGCGRNGPR